MTLVSLDNERSHFRKKSFLKWGFRTKPWEKTPACVLALKKEIDISQVQTTLAHPLREPPTPCKSCNLSPLLESCCPRWETLACSIPYDAFKFKTFCESITRGSHGLGKSSGTVNSFRCRFFEFGHIQSATFGVFTPQSNQTHGQIPLQESEIDNHRYH